MNNYLTRHARTRMQQRGIDKLQVALIEAFGTFVDQKENSEYGFIPDEQIPALRDALDKLSGVRLIVSRGAIITTMHETRRLKRDYLLRRVNTK